MRDGEDPIAHKLFVRGFDPALALLAASANAVKSRKPAMRGLTKM